MNTLKNICPICVLVGGTWIVLLTLRFLGYDVNETFIALLMGGSVVGISYTLGKRMLRQRSVVWKLLSIPLGFAAAWALLYFAWGYVALALLTYVPLWTIMRGAAEAATRKKGTVDVEKELEDCCD